MKNLEKIAISNSNIVLDPLGVSTLRVFHMYLLVRVFGCSPQYKVGRKPQEKELFFCFLSLACLSLMCCVASFSLIF